MASSFLDIVEALARSQISTSAKEMSEGSFLSELINAQCANVGDDVPDLVPAEPRTLPRDTVRVIPLAQQYALVTYDMETKETKVITTGTQEHCRNAVKGATTSRGETVWEFGSTRVSIVPVGDSKGTFSATPYCVVLFFDDNYTVKMSRKFYTESEFNAFEQDVGICTYKVLFF